MEEVETPGSKTFVICVNSQHGPGKDCSVLPNPGVSCMGRLPSLAHGQHPRGPPR